MDFGQLSKIDFLSQSCEPPVGVISKIRTDGSIYMHEAKLFLDWIVSDTLRKLDRLAVHSEDHTRLPYSSGPLRGLCGWACGIIIKNTTDLQIECQVLDIQELDDILPHRPANLEHTATLLPLFVNYKLHYFLIDPTFSQFFPDDQSYSSMKYAEQTPGVVMNEMWGGEELLEGLLLKGWIKLTTQSAQIYLESFNLGLEAFEDPRDAFRVFSSMSDKVDLDQAHLISPQFQPQIRKLAI